MIGKVLMVVLLASTSFAQQPIPKSPGSGSKASPSDPALDQLFQEKIKDEWEALKHKDKKAYSALLDDDYQEVEIDGRGERNKNQAINELADTNVANYTLWGFKALPLGPDAVLVIYEVTQQFPPKSVVRYSRVYISEIWVKHKNEWKELHYQETHVK